MRRKQRVLLLIVSWLLLGTHAFGQAASSIYIRTNGTCDNGSYLWVIGNNDQINGIIATVTRTVTLASGTYQASYDIPLAPGQQKTLGCAIQNLHPEGNGQLTWQIKSASYQ